MSKTEIAKQAGALCVGATAFSLGMTTGAALGAMALINIGVLWRDLKSGCTAKTRAAAIAAATEALEASREYKAEDLDTAAALLTHLPRNVSFDPSETLHLIGQDTFAETMADRFVELLKPDPKAPAIGEILKRALKAGFESCAKAKDFHEEIQTPAILAILQAVYRVESQVLDLVKAVENQLGALKTEYDRTLVQMAKRIAIDVADRDAALAELDRAVGIVQRMHAAGQTPSNHPDFVDEVFARVADLNRDNDQAAAAEALKAALAREEEETIARQTRILTGLIDQFTLMRDVDGVVEAELKKLPLDVPDPSRQFAALHAIFKEWWDRGRDKGLNFDLEVAVALGKAMFLRASDSYERGTGLNSQAVALQDLAARDPNRSLEEVVEIKRQVLDHWTRRDHPRHWAGAQMNLGVTLNTFAAREPGTEKLDEAVKAYREALKEFTRDRVPMDWAMTQMNLGITLTDLGASEPGTDKLDEAITALREALRERTREIVPLGWARTQTNLGNALFVLGQRETKTDKLIEAVAAYGEALKEKSQELVPHEWANTLGNQGLALMALAERKGDAEIARQALDQLTEAESALRDGGHFAWAKTFERQIPKAQALLETLTADTKA